jgi:hypothetical protein
LESADALPPTKGWAGVLQVPHFLGGQLVVTQAFSSNIGTRFFRLVAKGNQAGLDYIISRQNDDGSWGDLNGTLLRDTATALETLALLGQTATASYQSGVSALASLLPRNNDDASRQAIALAQAGWDVSNSGAGLINSQNLEIFDTLNSSYPGRGWGLAAGFGNSTLDSALVLRALKSAGKPAGLTVVKENLAGSAMSSTRFVNLPAGSSNLVLYARAVFGVVRFTLTYPDNSSYYLDLATGQTPTTVGFPVTNGVVTVTTLNLTGSSANYTAEIGFTGPDGYDAFRATTALTYLGLAQNPDGGWGIGPGRDSQLMVTAEVIRSLAAWGQAFAPQQVLLSGKAWLLAHQNIDGGFSSTPGASNVPETGLAVLAILAVDPTASLASAADYLKAAQLPDGSWGGSPYQTALAMQAGHMPPVVSAIPGQTIVSPYAFAPVTLDNFVRDPDNSASQMTWLVSGNLLLSVELSNRVAFVSYSASNNPSISEQLTFTATDPNGLSSSATALFRVASNQPPVVSPIPGQSVGAPQPFAPIYLDNYVSDPDETTNQIAWTVTGNTQLVVSVSNRIVTITYPAAISNTISEQLTFTATDPAGLSASTSTNFSVAPDQPPVVGRIPGQTVAAPYAFAPIVLDNYVSDLDNIPAQLTWQVTGNVKLAVTLSNRVAFLNYAPNPATNFTEQLTFTAFDPAGKSGSATAVFVVNSNQPPFVTSIPSQSIYAFYSFAPINLDGYVSDADELPAQMTWQVTGNLKLTVAISNRVANIGYPANLTSNLTEVLTFRATDPFGLSSSTTAGFTVNSNRVPVVNTIPAQTNLVPVPFIPISLDNYVSDPGDAATQMTWTVSGNVKLSVAISNRVATVSYPTDTTNSITELLTFRATDPWGLVGSNNVWFSALYTPPDYVISRGGSTNDSRVVTMSTASYNNWVTYSINITNNPAPSVTYNDLGYTDLPPNAERLSYRLSAASNATLGTYPISVEYHFFDSGNNSLGPLTNNYYLFRIKVTQ